jgi:alkanesulfonate monooxygenase SsuD/methylene tetrahydromethanopterin reductase-like flavin-dependent oxidoreductase (luciferase family)
MKAGPGLSQQFRRRHHFSDGIRYPTLNLLTWIAARTRTLRVGSAVMFLPWHNTVLIAEQAAMLDMLSRGRLDFGIGKGYRYSEFRGFQVAMEEAEARFDEALDVVVRAWTTRGRFSHHGRFWQFEEVVVEPPPYQMPHPPLWMAAGSAESVRRVAERGANLLLDQYASPEVLGERIALFKKEIESRGRVFDPLSVAVARDAFVAKDPADKQAALERNAESRRRIVEVSRVPGRPGGSHVLAYEHTAATREAVALSGSPDEIARKLEALRAAGVTCILASFAGSRESLRRFAREIIPAFAA